MKIYLGKNVHPASVNIFQLALLLIFQHCAALHFCSHLHYSNQFFVNVPPYSTTLLIIPPLLFGRSEHRHREIRRSSVSENSGGSMKTLIVPALLSGKKSLLGAPLWGLLCWKNYIRSCKSFGGAVKLGFSMWLPVLLSGKGPTVFPMSGVENQNLIIRLQMQQTYSVGKSTGPRSSTCENSGGPMKTLIVSVLLSAKKFL